MDFAFDNSFARDLPGFYVNWAPDRVPSPRLRYMNQALAIELGLDVTQLDESVLASFLSGNSLPEGAEPIAQAYSGHQFGQFSPQLGDGRALLIGEVLDTHQKRRDIAFKGSGPTPFARNGDGKAALGPMLREVLIGEAMHALGIPTTRSLAVVETGEFVRRETRLPGATLTRVAASHLRVGTFEYYAARGDRERVRKLADYTIARHDPALLGKNDCYREFLLAVVDRQAALVAQWMGVGFIHGVMNTDNMSISGETIDYGPCAFMEAYNPMSVFSSIDRFGRYAYQNQPTIAQWNLARLAESLLPLLSDDEDDAVSVATEAIERFPALYQRYWLDVMRAKLGLSLRLPDWADDDRALVDEWLALLQRNRVDFTLAWRHLADAAEGNSLPLQEIFDDSVALEDWLKKWRIRCDKDDGCSKVDNSESAESRRANALRGANPWLIPRNHCVEEALTAASDEHDFGLFEQLLNALKTPYEEQPEFVRFSKPAPESFTANYCTFCGT